MRISSPPSCIPFSRVEINGTVSPRSNQRYRFNFKKHKAVLKKIQKKFEEEKNNRVWIYWVVQINYKSPVKIKILRIRVIMYCLIRQILDCWNINVLKNMIKILSKVYLPDFSLIRIKNLIPINVKSQRGIHSTDVRAVYTRNTFYAHQT